MAFQRAFGHSSILALLLPLVLLVSGCAEPKFQPEQFVGAWGCSPEGAPYPFELELLPNGTGVTSGPYDPHPVTLKWYLRQDKLVIAPHAGLKPTEYDVRFNKPDEIVLHTGDFEFTATRTGSE